MNTVTAVNTVKNIISFIWSIFGNFGNFFAQNLFVASGGVLLISSTMKSLGYKVDPVGIVVNTIPIAIITFVLVFAYNLYFDRQMAKWEGK